MVICLERGADLHMAQLMPLPLTVSCFSKIQSGFAFLVPAYLGSPGKRAVKRVCVCVCVCLQCLDTILERGADFWHMSLPSKNLLPAWLKSRMAIPFRCRLTQVLVQEKKPLDECLGIV